MSILNSSSGKVFLLLSAFTLTMTSTFAGSSNNTAGRFVIATNWAENTLSLVDIDNGIEKAKIRVGAKPYVSS